MLRRKTVESFSRFAFPMVVSGFVMARSCCPPGEGLAGRPVSAGLSSGSFDHESRCPNEACAEIEFMLASETASCGLEMALQSIM